MKRENMNYKIKYKKHIEDHNKDYKVNPELSRVETTPHDFIDLRGRINRLNNYSNNSKIGSYSSSKIINQNIDLDAKIKHRKKREGD